jgi:MFS superfamily sulfate permease-like transporter
VKEKKLINRIFPFLSWFKDLNSATIKADLIAGITVALVLIPQSMAYAQLAGLPAFYGLYAAFLPPMVASLFGSSRQLATGPVAVVSLMSAASLGPLATAGSEGFIAYSILLALCVGLFQLFLGLARLGVVVNLLSHPVVVGFTNAAALIIATSQLSKIFGVSVDEAEHHYETIIEVVKAAFNYTHWPTFALGLLAFGIMFGLKKYKPKVPNVLVAVLVTTVISWAFGFEHTKKVSIDSIKSQDVYKLIVDYNETVNELNELAKKRTEAGEAYAKAQANKLGGLEILALKQEYDRLNKLMEETKHKSGWDRKALRYFKFEAVSDKDGIVFYPQGSVPSGVKTDGNTWILRVKNDKLDEKAIKFSSGGAVIGEIPAGLPKFSAPPFDLGKIIKIFPVAIIISLLGFMEAISIAKAMAVKTGQRLDPNQELIGQGLANVLGSAGQSYTVSGSFSRSAVNLQAGALTGLSSVFTSLIVLVTLMFLTPLLYHLPQSVLAAVIMMAVIGLINFKGIKHAWHTQKYDGVTSVVTFIFTLGFAPHLDKGIMIGVLISVGHYIYRNMKPRVIVLARHEDGTLRDADRFNLQRCEHITAISFQGDLFFASTSYLEDRILERISAKPLLKHIIIFAEGLNDLDASGEEMLSIMVDRLRDKDLEISFVGVNDYVTEVMKRSHLYDKIGKERFFRTEQECFNAIYRTVHENTPEEACPLLNVVFIKPNKGGN